MATLTLKSYIVGVLNESGDLILENQQIKYFIE